ncbi:cysteine desulfurase [bacterium]|nr:cysteine desulfurase [bacterium]
MTTTTTRKLQDAPFDVARVRADFPILKREVNGKPLVYLDNGASSQMPQPVIDRLNRYHTSEHSNVHRGVHTLSEAASAEYEAVRGKAQRFINAKDEREIVFVRGATEGVNLVMHGYGRLFIKEGDEILVSAMEHHANIVPWQMLCQEKGCVLKVIPMNDAGELLLDEYQKLLGPKTKLVAVTHVSNALGTVNPVKEMVAMAHEAGAVVLVDGAQAVPHMKVDVQDLDADFYVFSGHKMCGPTGSGILYGKAALLVKMQPFMGGGDMILSVSFEKTTYNEIPFKFEAGTPAIAPMIGLGAAIDYLEGIGMDKIGAYEHQLLAYATERFAELEGVRIVGTAKDKAAVISFVIEGVHPHDVGTILDSEGVAVRAGHHCAQPVMIRMGVPATTRASLAFYNTPEEVDALIEGIKTVQRIFG